MSIDDQQALALSTAIDRGEVQLVRSTGAVAISFDPPAGDDPLGEEFVEQEATQATEVGP